MAKHWVFNDCLMAICMDESCCRPLEEAESAFFSREAVLKKYECFKTLIEKVTSAEKPLYLEDFLREASISPGQKVLEVGINPGYLAVYLAEIVGDKGKVVLVQLDRIITADAKENIAKHRLENIVEVTEARMEKIPFISNYFDTVLSDRTTSLIKDKSTLIKEMARVTKIGGKIVIADCILRKPFMKNQVEQFRRDFACVFQAASIEKYVDIFENSELKNIRIVGFMDEKCVKPHARIARIVQGRLGFAVISGVKK